MVNENNKYVPKVPETFTVAYAETNQEIRRSPLSAAAQSKVIRKWGGGYVSERVGEISPSYGPCKNSLCGCSCSSYNCVCEGEIVRIEDIGTSLSVHGRAKDTDTVFGKAGGQVSSSLFGYKDNDGELKVLSSTAGFETSLQKGIKAKLSADLYNIKHDGVQVRVGVSADTSISVDKGLEVKALGTGFSVGKDHIGISLPFGELKFEW